MKQITDRQSDECTIEMSIAQFCAFYFAQATTLSGHKMAGHGDGIKTIERVFDCYSINEQRYDLAVNQNNKELITESRSQYRKL